MAIVRINLLRDRVPPRARRVRLFYGMLAYLAASGVVLVVISAQQTQAVLRLLREERILDAAERWFRRQYPQFGRLTEFAEDVRLGLTHCQAQLSAIDRTLQRRADLAPLLLALTEPMLPGMRLTMFSFDREKKAISFEVAVPATMYNRRSDREIDLMAAWNSNPVLKTRLRSRPSLIGTRRARGPTGFEYVLSFGGVLRDGGGGPES